MSELSQLNGLLKIGRAEIGQIMADLAELNASIVRLEVEDGQAGKEIAAAELAYRAILRDDLTALKLEQLSLIRERIAYFEARQVELSTQLKELRERADSLKASVQFRDGKCKRYEERIGELRKDIGRRAEKRRDRLCEEHILTKWAAYEGR